MLAFFSKEILEVWTRDPNVVRHASLLISLLTIGNALNGLMTMPYALQIAHGQTKLVIYQNIVALILLVPAVYFAAFQWGGVGAAGVWIVLNIGYILISVSIMHRRLLPNEKWNWYFNDVLKLLAPALGICIIGRIIYPDNTSAIVSALVIAFVSGLALIATFMSANLLRNQWSLTRLHV